MDKKVLIAGNDLNTQKLLVDILEITLRPISIDKTSTIKNLIMKLNDQNEQYNLVIVDSSLEKHHNENLIMDLKNAHPTSVNNLIFIFDSLQSLPDSNILFDITYVTKPFSLDVFSEMLENVCIK